MSCPKGWIFNALLFDAWHGVVPSDFQIWLWCVYFPFIPRSVKVPLFEHTCLYCPAPFLVLACLHSSRNALYGLPVKTTVLPRRTFVRLFGLDFALGGGEITNETK